MIYNITACTVQATIGVKSALLIGLRYKHMYINTVITTYNTKVTCAARDTWEGSSKEKAVGHKRSSRPLWCEQKEEKITGKHIRGIRRQWRKQGRSLDRYSERGDRNLPEHEQEQGQESILAGEGSEKRKQRSSTIQTRLGNVLPKNKRFSADEQNVAQNYATMRVVVTMQFWTAVSPK